MAWDAVLAGVAVFALPAGAEQGPSASARSSAGIESSVRLGVRGITVMVPVTVDLNCAGRVGWT